jgi:hypothetical protein
VLSLKSILWCCLRKGQVLIYNYLTNLKNKVVPISGLNSYFFNLNKWPIDKAPKVSNSSYLVGMVFLILFHCYAFNTFENFSATAINILGFNLQVFSLLLTILIWLLLSENSSRRSFGIFLFPLFFFLFFLFFFYNTKVIVST